MIIRAAVVGLGVVGKNLLHLIAKKKEILKNRYGIAFQIICLADSQGMAFNKTGFDINHVLCAKATTGNLSRLKGYTPGKTGLDTIVTVDLDLVFEASPVDLKTGGLGLRVAEAALSKGISVVLANKAPVVLALESLENTAKQSGAGLRYSATVCGGLPIINIIRRDMIAAELIEIKGIFNSTTNFILDEMRQGRDYADALAETQKRGIAETDPTLDVEGWDTANKLVIIANSILRSQITLDDVKVTGITKISANEILKVKKSQKVIKLVASFKGGHFTVSPRAIDQNGFLAQCSGWEMGIEIRSDIYGRMYHKLWEREPVPTAASMLRDAVDLFVDMRH